MVRPALLPSDHTPVVQFAVKTPQQWMNTQQTEIPGSGGQAASHERFGPSRECVIDELEGGHALEGMIGGLPVPEVHPSDADAGCSSGAFTQPDQALRIRVRQWLQQHTVDQTENRRVHADAQCQSEDQYQRKRRCFPHRTKSIAEIAPEIFNPRNSSPVAVFIPIGSRAEFSGGIGIGPGGSKMLGQQFLMQFELKLQSLEVLALLEKTGQSGCPLPH